MIDPARPNAISTSATTSSKIAMMDRIHPQQVRRVVRADINGQYIREPRARQAGRIGAAVDGPIVPQMDRSRRRARFCRIWLAVSQAPR
jgi:hypothetical protein